jgi:methionyl-tRNA formyltransferase
MRIAWLSANVLGYELLKEALKLGPGLDVVAVITLNEKATTIMYDAIETEKWHEFGVVVYEIKNINEEAELLKGMGLDNMIVCGWRQLLEKEVLDAPQNGIIGFHPSLLPEGRGSAPIINTILEGREKSGVTMYYMDKGIDSGDIIGQEPFIVGKDDYAMDIYNKVISSGKKLVRKYLPLLVEGKAPRIPQKDADATYFRKVTLKDNEINPALDSADMIYKKIRAFSKPYRGAYLRVGGNKLTIWNAELD